jgi:hypothetical protein
MALRGTLKDFGIADIFQLIGQQAKTGVLHLRGKDEEVHVLFHEGNVVGAEQSGRKKKDLLGRMLVAAELIREEQLDEALEEQRRTLQRLGDILVARNAISRERLREMTQLQATETLYRLFTWKSGTYEFEVGPVEWDRSSMTPLRSESVLMEGFRMVDEWPAIRKRITSLGMTFVPLRSLPEPRPGDRDLDGGPGPEAPDDEGIGPNERRIYGLAIPGRTVRKLVDLSRLGEFETCRALLVLVTAGYLRPIPPRDEPAAPGPARARLAGHAGAFAVRLALTALVLAAAVGLLHGRAADPAREPGFLAPGQVDPTSRRLLAGPQLSRIRAALGVYRAENGEYPATLEPLIETGLLREDDLRHPWGEPYLYRRDPGPRGFVLDPPLP